MARASRAVGQRARHGQHRTAYAANGAAVLSVSYGLPLHRRAKAEQSVSVMAGTSVLTAMMIVMPGISPVYHDILNLLRELLENVMAAFLPLATQSLYRTLGFHWASSLLGFVALGLSCIPVVLIKYGRRLRERSPFMEVAGHEGGEDVKGM